MSARLIPRRPQARRDPRLLVDSQLEEYRQVYALAQFRLNALDQRVPIAGATLSAMLGTVALLPASLQLALLVGLPLSLVWLVRTTINHARSLEDALRRIEEIERSVNRRLGEELLCFQSSHPSRGVRIGGRTGAETTEAVLAASAVLLGACLHGLWVLLSPSPLAYSVYAAFIAVVCGSLLAARHGLSLYRYEKQMGGGVGISDTPS
ncbi:MAG: hypothetical protein ACKVS8_11105 [Phycisphaerales bacterium]